jgi:undecaprenyl-diphosphatase
MDCCQSVKPQSKQAITIMEIDYAVTKWINSFAGQLVALDFLIVFAAEWGVFFLIAMIALRWWSTHERGTARYGAVCCGLAVVLGLLSNYLISLFVHRMRPYDSGLTHLIVARSGDPSFPSDHSTVVFAIAFSLLFRRDRYAVLFLIGAILVGFSRIYIGTHYLSDVIGGAGTAFIAALIVFAIYKEESPLNRWVVKML